MIEVEKALEIIHQTAVKNTSVFAAVSSHICGCVLAEEIVALISLPHFDQSSMDGYAIKIHDSHRYKVVGEVAAGCSKTFHLNPGEAVRIFTGAMVPASADSVVIQESVLRTDDEIVLESEPKKGQNIRSIGSQIQAGDRVLSKGDVLNPASLGLLQSLGIRSVQVYKKPSVALVLTGNELLKATESLQDGKVYESNSVVLDSVLRQQGIEAIRILYTKDSLEETQNTIATALESDMVLISGGISVGDYDFVQESLLHLGVKEQFYKVKQKPGKPLFYGTKEDKIIFALPGNPASTLNCYYVYVLPILYKLLGKETENLPIVETSLNTPIKNSFGRALFLKARVEGLSSTIIDELNSATLLSFSKANALVYVPWSTAELKVGTTVKTWLIPTS